MRQKLYNSVAWAVLARSLAAFPVAASAQDWAREQATEGGSDLEIIVTAQKREQKLSDVPVSVVAATGETLQAAGVVDATDLGSIVSGFTASTSVFGPPVFSLRGVNFNSFQASAPPTVSSYIDEASIPYPIMGQALFLDIERVEVLKGPQGTLFGQNATGGSINVIAAKPCDSTP